MKPPRYSAFHVLVRGAVVLVFDAAALLLLSEILPGLTLDGPGAALVTAALFGLLNAILFPTLARLALPLSVLTLGLFGLLLNGLILAIAIWLVPGASIDGVFEATVVTIGIAALTAVVSALLAIDDDFAWHRNVVLRQAKRSRDAIETDVPGVVFCEIDGLAHEVASRALRDGTAPNLSRWVSDGGHRFERWETDWSSQTGACQAGLLHGSNDDMPAFRWWEKDRGGPIVTNHPRDAVELERRRSDGRGLLHADGASRANILSGDAPHSMLTMSTVLRRRRPIGRDYAAYFASPYAVAKTMIAAVAEIGRERRAQARQRRRDVRPRIDRSRTYAAVRAWATVVQLDLQVSSVVADILAGRPVVYTTFLAYDEVAHHSGIERADTLAVLAKVDRQIGRIALAAEAAPRPYRLVALSDHGQSQGATFLQRYGETLEDLVSAACGAEDVDVDASGGDEALSYLSAGLTEMARDETPAARAVRTATRGHREDGVVDLSEPADGDADEEEVPEVSVMASGCLGLISFPREPGRVTRERLDELHPRLLPALVAHPGVGFALVRSQRDGPVVIGAEGTNYLQTGRIEGADPLAPFGPNAAEHVRRTDRFEHCPDVVVNSTYWPTTGEVAAFEELVGSHGGMGGGQSFPFICFPAELDWPDEPVVGAERVHRIMCGWLASLGQDAYAGPIGGAADA